MHGFFFLYIFADDDNDEQLLSLCSFVQVINKYLGQYCLGYCSIYAKQNNQLNQLNTNEAPFHSDLFRWRVFLAAFNHSNTDFRV